MSSLSPEDIGYFDPTAIPEDLVYNDVFDFKRRIETCVQLWSDKAVRNVIAQCLRGNALKWYSTELHADAKRLLSHARNSNEWIRRLITRFKLDKDSAVTRIHGTKYRLDDAKYGRMARQYADKILKLSKHGEISSVKCLEHIYWNLASEFRHDIAWRSNMTIEEFLEQLDKHQETWKERAGYYRIHRRSPPVKQTPPQNKNRGWPLQETSYQFKTPYYGTNKPANQMSAQEAMQTAPQVAPQLATRLSTPSIAELEAQAIIQSCTQLAQEATSQAANQITAYEEDLQVAIATPLPQAVECRRCLAGFSSNSQLHKHVRETHNKKIDSASKSAVPQESGVSQLVHLETKATSKVEHSAVKSAVPQKSGVSQVVHSETKATSIAEHSVSESVVPQKSGVSQVVHSETKATSIAEHSVSESVVPQKSGASQLVHSEIEETTSAAAAISVAERSDPKSIAPPNCSVLTLTPAESTSEVTRASARSTRSMTAASASKSQPPFKYSASSLLTSETTSPAGETPLPASRPVTPPPTYRAMSPSPPAYQPKKNYLTVADLYVRYAPLKSVLSATKGTRSATQKTTASRAYLTIQNLYERFSQKTRSSTFRWAPKSSANSKAFDVKRSYIAGQESSKSMGRNAGKAMPSVMKSPAISTAGRIKSSASKSACDSKSSPIDFFRDSKSNVKTRFFTIANPNAQRLVTQQQRQTTPSFFASP